MTKEIMTHQTVLADLVMAWYKHRPLGSPLQATFEPRPVPAELLETITTVEPYRAEAMEDAAVYLGIPYLVGFGMEIFPEVFQIGRFESWAQSISPFNFRVEWTLHMDGREPSYDRQSWERVALEDGRWKIVRFWSRSERRRMIDEIERMKHYLATRCGAPGVCAT